MSAPLRGVCLVPISWGEGALAGSRDLRPSRRGGLSRPWRQRADRPAAAAAAAGERRFVVVSAVVSAVAAAAQMGAAAATTGRHQAAHELA